MKTLTFNKKLFSIITISLFFSANIFSQGQANWWYFGVNAGVSFQTGNPVAVAGGLLNTNEGCAAISDYLGNLLFYTDGITVWNRNHVQMPNGFGLMGNPSTTQSGVIVQRPGSANIYYIFTAANNAGPNGLRWSEVDMTLQAGFGDVTANKNILLWTPSTEKITGVRHCNNVDVWVVTHDWNSNQFRSYLVTSAGISATPVLSSTGTIHTGNSNYTIGYLKVSTDGSKLSGGVDWANYIELFDFSNTTGIVSNGFVLDSTDRHYGTEFSPNGTLLYSSTETNPGHLYQWNLCGGSDSAIKASKQLIASGTSTFGALQVGPDNKMYLCRVTSNYLAVINNPDVPGVGCNFVNNGVLLTAGTSARFGLPNFIASYLRQPPLINDSVSAVSCLVASFGFTSSATNNTNSCTAIGNNVVSVSWNFGDPLSGPNNNSSLNSPSHAFSGPGTYNVTLAVNYTCYTDSADTTITILSCGINAALTGYSDVCTGSCTNISATASGGTPPYTYSWTPNIGNGPGPYQVCPSAVTAYSVIVVDSAGATDTAYATIYVNPLPVILTSSPSPICVGSSAPLTAAGASLYSWSPCTDLNTCTGSSVTASPPVTTPYTVIGTDANGCSATASVTVTVNPLPLVVSPPAPAVCYGDSVVLTMSGAVNYHWLAQTGLSNPNGPDSTTVTATPASSTTYTVTGFSAEGCSASITFMVIVNPNPIAIITPDGPLSFCPGEDVILTASGGVSYLWSDASISSSITANTGGTYTVIATDTNGCRGTASAIVTVNPNPPASLTPNGNISLCNVPGIMLNANTGSGLIYEWYHDNILIPSANTSGYFATTAGSYQVKIIDALTGCFRWTETAVLTLSGNGPVVTITSSPTIGCLHNTIYIGYGPQSVTLTANSVPPAASYLLSTNEVTQSISITAPGAYSVTAYDSSGCASASSPESQIDINVVDIRCGQGKKKIILCHVPEGNPGNPQTICVAPSAIPHHLEHHQYDCIGPCSLYYQRRSPVMDDEISVSLYPNPFNSSFIVNVENYNGEIIHLNLSDATGRLIFSDKIISETTEMGETLSKGVYHIEIIVGAKREIFKLVKL